MRGLLSLALGRSIWCAAVLSLLGAAWAARAQQSPPASAVPSVQGGSARASATALAEPRSLSVSDWLRRMHEAAQKTNYVGTFVVSAATGNLSSSRIWNACEGQERVERVEALSGAPRITYRMKDRVHTFFPESAVMKSERREVLDVFPNLRGVSDAQLAQFYEVKRLSRGRVAGLETDVLLLEARDPWRYGYRIWSERRSGLIVKLQTLDADGGVVEQSAFSELQLDAPLSTQEMRRMMDDATGFTVQKSALKRTTAEKEGWALSEAVPGFSAVSCYRRPMSGSRGSDAQQRMVQWSFSDGLATVSLFIEPALAPAMASAAPQEGDQLMVLGATHTLLRHIQDAGGARWRVTAVGEVPAQTLDAFVGRLVRLAR